MNLPITTKNFICGVLKDGKFYSIGLINSNKPVLKVANVITAGKALFGSKVKPDTYTQTHIDQIKAALCVPVNMPYHLIVHNKDQPYSFVYQDGGLNITNAQSIILAEENWKTCAYRKNKNQFCYGHEAAGAAQLACTESTRYRIVSLAYWDDDVCICDINEVVMIDPNAKVTINGNLVDVQFNPQNATTGKRQAAFASRW